ncbi:hypothetical protein [Gordonia malaquae]|nr:hypothetical protein [Gordonia malaquae]
MISLLTHRQRRRVDRRGSHRHHRDRGRPKGRRPARRDGEQVEEQAKTIREIWESTVNSHQRPMRYDLDDVSDAVGDVRALVETIGAEVREDRVARRAGDQALPARLDELAVRLDRQDAIAAKHHSEDQ